MVVVRNIKHIFQEVPAGYPVPDKTTVTDTSETIDLDAPLNGGFLLKTLVLSIDPYLRGRMRVDDGKPFYSDAFVLGQPLNNHGVGVVIRSENSAVKAGDHLYGELKFVEYAIEKDVSLFRVLPDIGIPWSVYVGVAGMPGETALYAWKEFSQAKKGEIVFVSTGAGPVGSFVIQLAKQQGLKVIGSAGSDEKVQFMKEIGADVAFNYKTTSTAEVLEKEGPINIYWDNVSGETLEAALENTATFARIIACGSITSYNSKGQGIRNFNRIFERSLSVNGFIVMRLRPKYEEEFYKTVPADIAAGKFKYREQRYHGLESVGRAILDVQTGKNTGKAVIVVAEN